jgi:hypothetical protein
MLRSQTMFHCKQKKGQCHLSKEKLSNERPPNKQHFATRRQTLGEICDHQVESGIRTLINPNSASAKH